MHGKANFYTVWCHRSSKSIFGQGSHPVNRNGQILCFEIEEQARAECDRLNATRSGSHVHYSVECAHDLPLARPVSPRSPTASGGWLVRWRRGADTLRRPWRPLGELWCRRVGLNY